MLGNFDVTLLKIAENNKKGSNDKYYTMSFLDESDTSFNCYITKEIYDTVKDMNVERFGNITISLSIYKDRDNHYNFNVKGIIPFKKVGKS